MSTSSKSRFSLLALAFGLASLTAVSLLDAPPALAGGSQVSGIRLSQTGNTGLMINVDVTAFYTTGTTETTAYLGTYYNQVPAVDWGDGSTVARYGYGPSTGIPLVATSTVVNGVTARAYRGSFSHTYGAPGSYTIEANSRCCPVSTPTNTLATGTIQTTSFTTSTPFSPEATITTSFVQNSLDVVAEAPGFAKVFAPGSVGIGAPSTLTFTIDNTASTLDANALDFTDNLPAGVVVAPLANVMNTCTGGTLTAVPGAAVISYTGGTVAAGATCTLSVDVSAATPGDYNNTSGDLTSSFGNSGTASDTLNVTAVAPPFSKEFAPDVVGIDMASTLTFTIDNSANLAPSTGLTFTDTLPAGLVVATPANAVDGCGGTLVAAEGSGSIMYSGGTVAASSSCTLSVDVISDTAGSYDNTSSDLISSSGTSSPANDTLTVVAPPGFTKAFDPEVVGPNLPSTLTFTIDNAANPVATTDLAFTDALPAGLVIATPANASDGCAGTLSAAEGADTLTFTGGSVAAGATCTISVDVVADVVGDYDNTSSDLTSSSGTSAAATASLIVTNAPGFSKSFSPQEIAPGGVTTLTFTIDNSGSPAATTDLEFIDNLPAGLTVADDPNIVNGCNGGTVDATAGAGSIAFSGGSVAAGATCTISVDVTADDSGDFLNVADPLSSSLGSSGTATAVDSLMVFLGVEIPTATGIGLAVLGGLLGLLGLAVIRRTRL